MRRYVCSLAALLLAMLAAGSSAFSEDAQRDVSRAPRASLSSADFSVPKSADDNGSEFDATSAVDKLEQQRAKLDKKSGNVSLSVSGTVSQQFIVAPK